MQKTKNRRILIVEDTDSPLFERAVLVLKENVVREEEMVVNEARETVLRYIRKYEKGIRRLKTGKKRTVSYMATLGGGMVAGTILTSLLLRF